MSTPMRRTPDRFVEVRAEQLEGAPVGERRRWSDDFKDRAVAASLEPGVSISAVARSLEITPSEVFGWLSAAAKRVSQSMARSQSVSSPRVEIEITGAVVRVAVDITEDDLRRLKRGPYCRFTTLPIGDGNGVLHVRFATSIPTDISLECSTARPPAMRIGSANPSNLRMRSVRRATSRSSGHMILRGEWLNHHLYICGWTAQIAPMAR
jgi:transposase